MSPYPVRRLRVFPNHQITLPAHFCHAVGLSDYAECVLDEKQLILRPPEADPLTQEAHILRDLIYAGYGGQHLLYAFRSALGLAAAPPVRPPAHELYLEDVVALPNFSLLIRFKNGQKRHYKCEFLLSRPTYEGLQDLNAFSNIHYTKTEVFWPDSLSLTNVFLYENGSPVKDSPRGHYRIFF